MSFLWVKYKNLQAAKVSTQGCNDIADFIIACQKELPRLLGSFDPAELYLSASVDGSSPLDSGSKLTDIPGYSESGNLTLYVHVIKQEMIETQAIGRGIKTIESVNLTTSFAAMKVSDNPNFEILNDSLLKGAGLYPSNEAIFYKRNAVNEQVTFLNCLVEDKTVKLGWISGPPGIGKSFTTLDFALKMAQEREDWVVSWIACADMEGFQIKGKVKKCFSFQKNHDWNNWLSMEKKNHILIIDGEYKKVIQDCLPWLYQIHYNSTVRRLIVVVSAHGVRTGNWDERDLKFKTKFHNVPSWTCDEFKEALKCQKLWDAVKDTFIKPSDSVEDKEAAIESKYFFAGGSAWCMLWLTEEQVRDRYKDAIGQIPDYDKFFSYNLGWRSDDMIHRLLSHHGKEWNLMSKFVYRKLGERCSVNSIDHFVRGHIDQLPGRSLENLFELRLIAFSKTRKQVKYKIDNVDGHWDKCPVFDFDPKNPDLSLFDPDGNFWLEHGGTFWLRPISEVQGGFNLIRVSAVSWDEESRKWKFNFEFIQLTKAQFHSLKLEYMQMTLKNITLPKGSKVMTNTIDVIFVGPEGITMNATGRTGSLRDFGWDGVVKYAYINCPTQYSGKKY